MYQQASSQSYESKSIEIVPNRLYWLSDRVPPKNQPNAYFFNIDNDLTYRPFHSDFGPLDLGKVYRFIVELQKLLSDPVHANSKFYQYTSTDTHKRTNAACLMGCFQIVVLGRTAEEAWQPFAKVSPAFADYRDASYGSCSYKCSILDCLRGLEYAVKLKWFDMNTFNLRDYEFYEKVENGDLNWIIPGKFVAFSGPIDDSGNSYGYRKWTSDDYVPIFKKLGVTTVIRLNNKQYEEDNFKKHGIKHHDLFFVDGSCPSDSIIDNFLRICEQEKGAIAVHCKAGLGRTGTLIAAYAMKHYKCLAADFIGFIRLARPGSILGPQQQFLLDKQSTFQSMTDYSHIYKSVSHTVSEFHSRRKSSHNHNTRSSVKSEMSYMDKKIAKHGDEGQADRLLGAKFNKGKMSIETTIESAYSSANKGLSTARTPARIASPTSTYTSPITNTPTYTSTKYMTRSYNYEFYPSNGAASYR